MKETTFQGTVLVTGATGTVGRRLAGSLARVSKLRVRAFLRDPSRAMDLAEQGVELVEGTYEDAASLKEAVRGVDTLVLITATNEHAEQQARAVLEQARRAKVGKIVRLSAIKASEDGPTDNTRQHARTERELRASGLAYVILRPQFFMQNLLGMAPALVGQGQLYSGVGDGRIGMIDARDVADCLAQAVLRSDFDGCTLELTGPDAITHDVVASVVAESIGREVEYIRLTPRAVAEGMRAFGANDWMVQLMTDYMGAYRDGFGDFVTDNVTAMTGSPARTLATFAQEALAPAAAGLGESTR